MNLDLDLLHLINGWCGTPALDALAVFADRMNLLKGGITIAAFWWYWCSPQSQERNRRIILAALAGTLLAVAVSRGLAILLPFRLRPMYTPDIGYHAPSIVADMDLEKWSSFPSDHAAMWFALAFGLWRISRRVGIAAILFSAIWICLVRVYLGIHYVSDLAAGALIGVCATWLVLRLPLARAFDAVLRLEQRKPALFYSLAFLFSYETANIFDDVRKGLHAAHLMGAQAVGIGAAVVLGAAGIVIGVLSRNKPARPDRVTGPGSPVHHAHPSEHHMARW